MPPRSIDEARRTFDAYARSEPRLRPLWDLCRRATPPRREAYVDDVHDVDPFDVDVLAADKPDDGWCAEQFFHERVKPTLLLLVGSHRAGEPHALEGCDAYEELYDLLIRWALHRPCACCSDLDDASAA